MSVTPTPSRPVLVAAFDTGISGTDGITDTNTPTFTGTTAPGSTVTLYNTDIVGTNDIGTATADANDTWTISLATPVSTGTTANQTAIDNATLDDGTHAITATAKLAGSDASLPSAPLVITIDTQPPDPPTAPVLTTRSASAKATGTRSAGPISRKP